MDTTDPMDTTAGGPLSPTLPGLEELAPTRPLPTDRGAAVIERYVRAQIAETNRAAGMLPRPGGRKISADQARTMVRTALLEAGYHPATRLPLAEELEGETCGSCTHLGRHRHNGRTYAKCAQVGATRGPGTDVRTSWPACPLWAPSDESLRGST